MNIKETFLKLTEYTIPFEYEDTIKHLLPSRTKKINSEITISK